MESRPELSPQDAQRGFPDYAELVADLRHTNDMLMSLAGDLRRLSGGADSGTLE